METVKENLNKENFWDELYKKYPKGVQVFCDWIDDYKKRNDWNDLFNAILPTKTVVGDIVIKAPKFHDLPLAMQIGIWIEFASERCGVHEWEVEDLARHDWRADITHCCEMMQFDREQTKS